MKFLQSALLALALIASCRTAIGAEANVYYASGKPFAVGCLQSGVKSGIWRYYYEDGSIYMAGAYDDGVCSGAWTVFDVTGRKCDRLDAALICDGESMELLLPAYEFIDWSRLSIPDLAHQLMPGVREGWAGPGEYVDGVRQMSSAERAAHQMSMRAILGH